MKKTMSLSPDHLVYAVPDLAEAVEELTARLGVRPSEGGRHPYGTHNALLALGDTCYLEIIAADPTQASQARSRPLSFGLNHLQRPKLVTWAASAHLETVMSAARAAGYDPGVVVEGARLRPDGVHLRWRSLRWPEARQGAWPPPGDGLVPFLIEWGTHTPHPATSSAQGVQLLELTLAHPRPAEIQMMLEALHIDIAVTTGPAPAISARLQAPTGIVTLG